MLVLVALARGRMRLVFAARKQLGKQLASGCEKGLFLRMRPIGPTWPHSGNLAKYVGQVGRRTGGVGCDFGGRSSLLAGGWRENCGNRVFLALASLFALTSLRAAYEYFGIFQHGVAGMRMKRTVAVGLLFQEAVRGWIAHRAQRLGASLAFYTTLALAPLTIIAVAVAGYFYGEEAARGGIVDQIEHLVGRQGAMVVEALIQRASEPQQSQIATFVSIGLLLFGATGVFAELKDSLDTIWEVKRKPGLGLWLIVKTQLLAFAVVVGTGFLLLVSLLLTALLTGLTHWLSRWLPVPVWTAHLFDVLVSFLVITVLFALIFKLLPDVNVRWKDVWIGAVFTTVLFMVGKFLLGIYIGTAGVGSIYGAAGSLVIVLVWTYYSSQILFFGAELIRAYSKLYSPEVIVPNEQAERVDAAKNNQP